MFPFNLMDVTTSILPLKSYGLGFHFDYATSTCFYDYEQVSFLGCSCPSCQMWGVDEYTFRVLTVPLASKAKGFYTDLSARGSKSGSHSPQTCFLCGSTLYIKKTKQNKIKQTEFCQYFLKSADFGQKFRLEIFEGGNPEHEWL